MPAENPTASSAVLTPPPLRQPMAEEATAAGAEEPPRSEPAAADPSEATPPPATRARLASRLKHALLRVIDVTALGFLEPVVRLCYREEPRLQLKRIGQFVALPVAAFMLFILLWAVLAPSLTTKYGSLPTPAEVWVGADSAFTFHDRETAKAEAYLATGAEREAINAAASAELERLSALVAASDQAVLDARAVEAADKDTRAAPLRAKLETLKEEERLEAQRRGAELETLAASIDGPAERAAYLEAFSAFKAWEDEQDARQQVYEDQIKAISDEKTPAVLAALAEQTRIAEERNFAAKIVELSGERSREVKLAETEERLAMFRDRFDRAEGAEAAKLAAAITVMESRIPAIADSTYAKPWTLPMQIVRSIVTVFIGFFVGVAIAVPLGVLCGLSRTFMAVMTPFIALFKPVSPIVWLLVLWIIVGGFFPDPDQSSLLDGFNGIANAIVGVIPIAGGIVEDIDINPALIASALTVAMCSLWATMVNTALGVASVDKDHLNVARVLRLGFWARLRKIILPSTLPLMFAGMRISLGIGWMVLIAAELLASSEGLGKYVNDMFQNGNTDSFSKIMAMVFVVGIIGLVLDRIMIICQRLVSFEGSVATV